MPPAVVGLLCPAASPTVIVLSKTKLRNGPLIHIGAKTLRTTEYLPLLLMKLCSALAALIRLPATPTLPLPRPVGIIHAKKPGYRWLLNTTSMVWGSIHEA